MPNALLTTQPGWAFATLAELRARGVEERVEFYHRDSTLVLPAEALPRQALVTVAETCGLLAEGYPRGGWDATRALVDALWRADVGRQVRWWLGPGGRGSDPRGSRGRRERVQTWTVVAETWGDTQVHRRPLADAVRQAMRAAFPRWREAPHEAASEAGVRLVVKADTRAALVGAQLATTLEPGQGARPGALRDHLACGLLAVAGLRPGEGAREVISVVDPFAGSGTILEAAGTHFGASALIGAEIERTAVRHARQSLRPLAERGVEAQVVEGSFEALEERVPGGAYLVSNLPFGERFGRVETRRLLRFLDAVAPRLQGIALLMARDQASAVAERLHLRLKNVIVLGQPAAITYGVRPRI